MSHTGVHIIPRTAATPRTLSVCPVPRFKSVHLSFKVASSLIMYNCLKWPFRDLQILATLLLFCFFTPKVAAYCLMLKHQQEKKYMMMNNDVISRVALSHAVSHVKHTNVLHMFTYRC